MGVLPDWDSIESTARWSDILFWAGIVCLVLLAATEVASHVYGNRSSSLSSEAARRAEEQHKQDADAAEKKLAGLENQTIARRLRPEQSAALVKALSPFAGQKITVWCSTAAWDCTDFAADFVKTFQDAGWAARDQVVIGIAIGGDVTGIQIIANPAAIWLGRITMPPLNALAEVLIALRLLPDRAIGADPALASDELLLRIGRIASPK